MGVSFMMVHPDTEAACKAGARTLVPVGKFEDLRSAIDAFRDGIVWEFRHGHWFGLRAREHPRDYFEILMSEEPDGFVNMVQADRCYREFAVALARHLGLAMFDPQEGKFAEL